MHSKAITCTYILPQNNLLFPSFSGRKFDLLSIWDQCVYFALHAESSSFTWLTGHVQLLVSCKELILFQWRIRKVRLMGEHLPDIDVHILLRNCTHMESHLGLERPYQNQFLCHISCSSFQRFIVRCHGRKLFCFPNRSKTFTVAFFGIATVLNFVKIYQVFFF